MTRRLAVASALAALSVSMSGCYVSLHPLVTADVQVFEPALVGAWEEKDATNKDVWVFKPGPGEKPEAYIVEVTEQSTGSMPNAPGTPLTASFEGRLGRFGDLLVLEIMPDRDAALGPLKDHGTLTSNLLPTHTFYRLRVDANALTLMPVDGKWLDRQIAARTIRIAHEHVGDDVNPHEVGQQDTHAERPAHDEDFVLLTAPTSQLHGLVRRWGQAGLFSEQDAGEFARRR